MEISHRQFVYLFSRIVFYHLKTPLFCSFRVTKSILFRDSRVYAPSASSRPPLPLVLRRQRFLQLEYRDRRQIVFGEKA